MASELVVMPGIQKPAFSITTAIGFVKFLPQSGFELAGFKSDADFEDVSAVVAEVLSALLLASLLLPQEDKNIKDDTVKTVSCF